MTHADMTLTERSAHLYRRLAVLQRIFQTSEDSGTLDAPGGGDKTHDRALCEGIRDLLEELIDHVRIISTIPFPLSEWRPGDRADDERWRALTEIERREVLALVAGYDSLITWGESVTQARGGGRHASAWSGGGSVVFLPGGSREAESAIDELKAAREHVNRFRQEMRFLERPRAIS